MAITTNEVREDIEAARRMLATAANEPHPDRQRDLAILAQAAATLAHAEVSWLALNI